MHPPGAESAPLCAAETWRSSETHRVPRCTTLEDVTVCRAWTQRSLSSATCSHKTCFSIPAPRGEIQKMPEYHWTGMSPLITSPAHIPELSIHPGSLLALPGAQQQPEHSRKRGLLQEMKDLGSDLDRRQSRWASKQTEGKERGAKESRKTGSQVDTHCNATCWWGRPSGSSHIWAGSCQTAAVGRQ